MIDWVNTKPDYFLKPIAKLPLDTSQLKTNSWFALQDLQKVMLASKLE